jgi:subtilisin family serine protease
MRSLPSLIHYPAREPATVKYMILRKRAVPPRGEDPFTELVAAGEENAGFGLPFQLDNIDDREVGELRADGDVEDLVLSVPLALIAPVENPTAEAATPPAWGIKAVGAESCPQDGSGVIVAVLDTGIERAHPAFAGLRFDDADLMDFTIDERGTAGAASDLHGHGTHVAATMFGRDVNGTRIGVARGIEKILIGKVLGSRGRGSTEGILNAIDWALARRADVISMSLGIDFPRIVTRLEQEDGLPNDIAVSRALEGYRSNLRLFDTVAAHIQARVRSGRGAMLVAAAGNESRRQQDARFTVGVAPPAVADGFISVGAVGATGDQNAPFYVAQFSNTGCLVAGPGVSILSAGLGGTLVGKCGTSMATPHVAGVLALWIQKLFPNGKRPNGWAIDVRRAMEESVLPIPGQLRNDIGLGMVQAPR